MALGIGKHVGSAKTGPKAKLPVKKVGSSKTSKTAR